MHRVFLENLQSYVFVYLNDIAISNTFEKHHEILLKVYLRLKDAGLTVTVSKCNFCKPQLRYLGYIVDQKATRWAPLIVTIFLLEAAKRTETLTLAQLYVSVLGRGNDRQYEIRTLISDKEQQNICYPQKINLFLEIRKL